MPIYSVVCGAGHKDQIWSRIVDRDQPRQCACGEVFTRLLDTPFVQPEITPYQSPVTGKEVASRAQRRDDLARNGCIEWEPGIREVAERTRQDNLEKSYQQMDATVDKIVTEMHTSGLV